MLTRRSMLIVLALLLAPFVFAGCGSDKTTSPIIQTPDTVPPAAPSLRQARSDYGAINLIWQRNTEADLAGYYVYEYDPDPGAENSYQRLTQDAVTGTGYKIEGLTPGTTHYFRVSAVDESGNESAYSVTMTVTVMPNPGGTTDAKALNEE